MDFRLKRLPFLLGLLMFLGALMLPRLSSAAEIVSFEEAFPEYQLEREIEEELLTSDLSDVTTLVGTDYFGLFKLRQVYKHYSISGELIWTTEALSHKPGGVRISRSGNIVLIRHWLDDPQGWSRLISDVYDAKGNHLFSFSSQNYGFVSSPNGGFYFSENNYDSYVPLIVFDQSGNEVFRRHAATRGYWSAAALDDSTLVYVTLTELMILKAETGEVITERPFAEITGGLESTCQATASLSGERIALWSQFDSYIVDRELNLISKMIMEGAETPSMVPDRKGGHRLARRSETWIQDIALSEDGMYMASLLNRWSTGDLDIQVATTEGSLIGKMPIILPAGERRDQWIKTSFIGDLVVTEFPVFESEKWKGSRATVYYLRSSILRLDRKSKQILPGIILPSRLLRISDSDKILELGDHTMRIWSKTGGEE